MRQSSLFAEAEKLHVAGEHVEVEGKGADASIWGRSYTGAEGAPYLTMKQLPPPLFNLEHSATASALDRPTTRSL